MVKETLRIITYAFTIKINNSIYSNTTVMPLFPLPRHFICGK